jgi:hypothetical protein
VPWAGAIDAATIHVTRMTSGPSQNKIFLLILIVHRLVALLALPITPRNHSTAINLRAAAG